MNYEKAQNKILKIINGMTGKYGIYVIFKDFITMAACSISNSVDKSQWDKREDLYLKTASKYDKDELERFAEMISLVSAGLTFKFGDFLGELYMQLEILNKRSGQFFTPYDVSSMMAQMLDIKDDQEIITLNESAVGSGGMVIAYAESMHRKGVNYQTKLRVICNDIDYDVVKMCYIQLSLLGIDAIIMQGNSLTAKMNEVWITPMHLLNKAREMEKQKQNEADDKLNKMYNAMKKLIELEKPVEENEQPVKEKVAAGQTSIFDFL